MRGVGAGGAQFDHLGVSAFGFGLSGKEEHPMARNFGIHRQFDNPTDAPVWPLWMMALAAVIVIEAATLLPTR